MYLASNRSYHTPNTNWVGVGNRGSLSRSVPKRGYIWHVFLRLVSAQWLWDLPPKPSWVFWKLLWCAVSKLSFFIHQIFWPGHTCLQLFRIILLLSPIYAHPDNKASFHQGCFPSGQFEPVSNYAIGYGNRSLLLLPQVAANFFQIFSFQQIKLWKMAMYPFQIPVWLGRISWGLKWCGTGLCVMSAPCSVVTKSY